jgi:hypothetical protein
METTDATVDGHHQLLTMLKITVFQLKLNIHTLPSLEHAEKPEETSTFHQFYQPQDAMVFKMPFKEDQSQSLLMLPTGANMHQEFSATVLPQSTTLSS